MYPTLEPLAALLKTRGFMAQWVCSKPELYYQPETHGSMPYSQIIDIINPGEILCLVLQCLQEDPG